jgi:hypothetical protein
MPGRRVRETFCLFFPLEVPVKKRLTFGFLPWVAAAGVCVVGGFVRGEDAAKSVAADGWAVPLPPRPLRPRLPLRAMPA